MRKWAEKYTPGKNVNVLFMSYNITSEHGIV